jgi:hypothetical protein
MPLPYLLLLTSIGVIGLLLLSAFFSWLLRVDSLLLTWIAVGAIVAWAIIGLLLWIPLLARTTAVFFFEVVAAIYTNQDPTDARKQLESAIGLYGRGFTLIVNVVSNNVAAHQPFATPKMASLTSVSGELAWAATFWCFTLIAVGIARWSLGYN